MESQYKIRLKNEFFIPNPNCVSGDNPNGQTVKSPAPEHDAGLCFL